MFSDIVSCVKSWIQRRVRKLKSCDGTSFRLQMWVVSWKRWCHMFNVTHRHVFVSQKVCRHSSCSVRTCARTRLVGVRNYGISCIQTRPLMRKFACGHVHVSQKAAQRDVFHSEYTSRPSRGSNQWFLASFRMWKVAYIHVLLCENLHLETSSQIKIVQKSVFLWKIAHCHVSQLIQFVETRRIRRSNGKLCLKMHRDLGSCVKICTRTWPCKSRKGTSFYSEHCSSNQ